MAGLPAKVRPGDPVRADDWNALIEYLAAGPQVRGGEGISVKPTLGGIGGGGIASVIVALSRALPGYFVPARIVAVHGRDGDKKRDVSYDAQPMGEGNDSLLREVKPRYLDIIPDIARIEVCKVGDLCIVVRTPEDDGTRTSDLAVLTERLIGAECPPTPTPTTPATPGGDPIAGVVVGAPGPGLGG